MSDHIKIRPTGATWVVRTAGSIIAESRNALELSEGDYPPVIYFPRDDVAMAFLERTDKSTHCPHKGDASYFTVTAPGESMANAAWSYETPKAGMEAIKDHIAFYTDRVTVEKL
ncbi:DUF427 domain-containing protein [Rhodobacterales bacterium HKCCE3408]|nr:DUF427 domain-containing protein [Rhodobacterales bacterium HKCCE3408]